MQIKGGAIAQRNAFQNFEKHFTKIRYQLEQKAEEQKKKIQAPKTFAETAKGQQLGGMMASFVIFLFWLLIPDFSYQLLEKGKEKVIESPSQNLKIWVRMKKIAIMILIRKKKNNLIFCLHQTRPLPPFPLPLRLILLSYLMKKR